jgi:hypothetical protein
VPWRNRYLAPVYALVIGFVVVALLGAATGGKSTSTGGTISFGDTSGKVDRLAGTKVEIFAVGGHQTGSIDDEGTVSVPIPNTRFTMCVFFPRGWTASDSTKLFGSPGTCWGPMDPPKGNMILSVTGPAK